MGGHARCQGGGRPRHHVAHTTLWPTLETLVNPVTCGNPESPLRWTCKSTHQLAAEMFTKHGIWVCDKSVARLASRERLQPAGAQQSGRGGTAPDLNAQFEHINTAAQDYIDRGVPFIFGTDHETPVFATKSIEAWWKQVGSKRYPDASELGITADPGGSNGYRSRIWKHELQPFADK